jgi:hypothetical protein
MHSFMTTVVGTLTILLFGLLLGEWSKRALKVESNTE